MRNTQPLDFPMTDKHSQSPAGFDKEWSLLLAVCRCGVLTGSKAVEHQVSRLAEFYGDTHKGRTLRALLEPTEGRLFRLVPSDGPFPGHTLPAE